MTVKNNTIKTLKRRLVRTGVGALMVTDLMDQQYLTGAAIDGTILLVSGNNKPVYFVNMMNYEQARKDINKRGEVEVIRCKGPVLAAVEDYTRSKRIKSVHFDPSKMLLGAYNALKRSVSAKLLPYDDKGGRQWIIGDMRMIKSDMEIDLLRKASRKTMKILKKMKKTVRTGMTEKEVALSLDIMAREEGCDNSFPTISATGPNTAYPHAVPTGRKLARGEHLLIDFGIRFKGYCSDLTRTMDNGRIDRQIIEFRKIILKARDLAIKKIKPGINISAFTERVEAVIVKAGFSQFMLHGLGHGVGLEVHERPMLNKRSDDVFRKGMIITIEPGLYMPGLGGVREEDVVLVTKNGCEVLTV